ncbi:hypothetical protein BDN71DRAFT_725641 [Pleurotus eryngii]|uniref:Uncharacterized protein n=1 Tax=Pleurotus eryngii TaxID=5323 RepID=A0A9P6DGF5_PLEER|nr:hypothetical protein BDN71DRAFT_725641 [Pleurotus eryngii]
MLALEIVFSLDAMIWHFTIFSIYATLLPTILVACPNPAPFTVFGVRPTGELPQFISLSALKCRKSPSRHLSACKGLCGPNLSQTL